MVADNFFDYVAQQRNTICGKILVRPVIFTFQLLLRAKQTALLKQIAAVSASPVLFLQLSSFSNNPNANFVIQHFSVARMSHKQERYFIVLRNCLQFENNWHRFSYFKRAFDGAS